MLGPEIRRCSAISKPAAWKSATSLSDSGVSGKTYEVERTHCQSATEQPGFMLR